MIPQLARSESAARLKQFLALAALLAAVIILWFANERLSVVSEWLTQFVPSEWEQKLGDTAERSVESYIRATPCISLASPRPLTLLAARLARSANLRGELRLTILDSEVVNAFALPDNRLIVTTGLVKYLKSGDELSGIIAHEIGHLYYRDPTSLIIRASGGAFVVMSIFGITPQAQLGSILARLGFNREMEGRADIYAVALLRKANLETVGFAAVMERFSRDFLENPTIFSSHPPSASRLLAIVANGSPGDHAMSDKDWEQIQEATVSCR